MVQVVRGGSKRSSGWEAIRAQGHLLDFVHQLCAISCIKILPIAVICLLTIPRFLPAVQAEQWVVLAASNEHVATCNGVVDGQTCSCTKGVCIGRELGTFKTDCTDLRVLHQCLFGQFHDTWCDLCSINLPSLCNCFETGHVVATDDHIAPLIGIHTALILEEIAHGQQGLVVGGENC